jgi:mannose-6-phosphate isomerase-like protein (cupin superfamily)
MVCRDQSGWQVRHTTKNSTYSSAKRCKLKTCLERWHHMTHFGGLVVPPPPNLITPTDSQTHVHTDENQVVQSDNISKSLDYLISPQDDPSRPAVYASGDLYTFLATTKETNFAFNVFDFFAPVGGGPIPHIHNYEHEAFFVKQGNVRFFSGNEAGVSGSNKEFILDGVPPGTFVFGPRLRPHGFKNPSSIAATSGTNQGARILSLTTPGGLDLLFEYAGKPVIDRNNPIPLPLGRVDPKQLEFGQRTGGSVAFPGYEPPAGTPNYVIVLPDDTPQAIKESIKSQLSGVDGFSVSTYKERPKFTGPFGIKYTSLSSFEETGNELSYNQFSLAPQTANISIQASLNSHQVVQPTLSSAIGTAKVKLNEQGGVDYSLTVADLDFGKLVEEGIPKTPDNELDDVTALHIHSGKRGSNGGHAFSIFDPTHQDEKELKLVSNVDGSTTISGTWNQIEQEIPTALSSFLEHGGLPGQESGFYFQVHTKGDPKGAIRGQIARTTDQFPNSIRTKKHELLYVREGQLSIKIGDEVRLIGPDTFVQMAPENEYSIGNFGNAKVESLAMSVPQREGGPAIPDSNGYNLINGSERDDLLLADSKDKLAGGAGNDILQVGSGGDNLLYGGAGFDQFWIANGRIPDTVSETRQRTDLGLSPLVDTRNTIVDFELGIDKIYIHGLNGISSFQDLKLLPAFGDIRSTSIVSRIRGATQDVSLVNVSGVLFNQLSDEDFIFV